MKMPQEIMNWLYKICILFLLVKCSKCFKPCEDYGVTHISGSNWSILPCSTCHCADGRITCSLKHCNKLSCHESVVPQGECCPVCLSDLPCKFEGKTYAARATWKYHPEEPCIGCSCYDGEIECDVETCPKLTCEHPYVPHGDCCPICPQQHCLFRTVLYNSAERWYIDDCTSCECNDGMVSCFMRSCSKIQSPCLNAVVVPGYCCPVCQQVVDSSDFYITVDLPLVNMVSTDNYYKVQFNLGLTIHDDKDSHPITITGTNIWKLSTWFSQMPVHDINDDRILAEDQVLTMEQASVAVIDGRMGDMGLISYTVNATNVSCDDMIYMCFTLGTVQNPQIISDRYLTSRALIFMKKTLCKRNRNC